MLILQKSLIFYKIDNYIQGQIIHSKSSMIKAFDIKSNEGLLYSFLGWNRCENDIQKYQNCKKTGIPLNKDPTECYSQAKSLQQCYTQHAMKIDPLCLPIFNDAKQCLFQSDSHILHCKQQINQFVYCNQKPAEYIQFLRSSTPQQRLPKKYDFVLNESKYDWN